MKLGANETPSRFAQRVLADFSGELLVMLSAQPLEKITVGALCARCGYPRATFYNYFEDIYDLLNYCWTCLSQEIDVSDYAAVDPHDRTTVLFGRLFDFMDEHRETVERYVQYNKRDGALVVSFSRFLRAFLLRSMADCPHAVRRALPTQLLAEYYTNTVLLVLTWSFLDERATSRDVAVGYLEQLLNDI